MSPADFIAKVKASQELLASLVDAYHPRSNKFAVTDEAYSSAPGAQAACNRVAGMLQKKEADRKTPQEEFADAVEAGNAGRIYSMLSAVWVGIPETREWRKIPGAIACCELLDDPPDPPEGAQDSEPYVVGAGNVLRDPVRDAQIIDMARKEHESEGTLEIDDVPKINELEENNGAYVAAWVWVSFKDTPLDKELT